MTQTLRTARSLHPLHAPVFAGDNFLIGTKVFEVVKNIKGWGLVHKSTKEMVLIGLGTRLKFTGTVMQYIADRNYKATAG